MKNDYLVSLIMVSDGVVISNSFFFESIEDAKKEIDDHLRACFTKFGEGEIPEVYWHDAPEPHKGQQWFGSIDPDSQFTTDEAIEWYMISILHSK